MNEKIKLTVVGIVLVLSVGYLSQKFTHHHAWAQGEAKSQVLSTSTLLAQYFDLSLTDNQRLEVWNQIIQNLEKNMGDWPQVREASLKTLDGNDSLYIRNRILVRLHQMAGGTQLIINLMYDDPNVFTPSADRLDLIIDALQDVHEKEASETIFKLIDSIGENRRQISAKEKYKFDHVLLQMGRYLGSFNLPGTVKNLLDRYSTGDQASIRYVLGYFLDQQIRHIDGRPDFKLTPEETNQIMILLNDEQNIQPEEDKIFVLYTLMIAVSDSNQFIFFLNAYNKKHLSISKQRQTYINQSLAMKKYAKDFYDTIRAKKVESDGNLLEEGAKLFLIFISMGMADVDDHKAANNSPEKIISRWLHNWLSFAQY